MPTRTEDLRLAAEAKKGHAVDESAARLAGIMRARNPEAEPLRHLPDVHPARIPRHIAIIMDGNGRWAEQRGFPRLFGHYNGARSVREVVTACGRIGVEYITLYSFSLENWKRPPEEVEGLMDLCLKYLSGEQDEMQRKGLRFRMIGQREGLPAPVLEAIDRVTRATEHNTRCTLCLAINYGSRSEIIEAAKSLARAAAAGSLDPEQIDESMLSERLYTAGMPDPDLMIRTAGEMRISNYLLWQLSYAELVVTPTLWPDFGERELFDAVRAFAARDRRFGGLSAEAGGVPPLA